MDDPTALRAKDRRKPSVTATFVVAAAARKMVRVAREKRTRAEAAKGILQTQQSTGSSPHKTPTRASAESTPTPTAAAAVALATAEELPAHTAWVGNIPFSQAEKNSLSVAFLRFNVTDITVRQKPYPKSSWAYVSFADSEGTGGLKAAMDASISLVVDCRAREIGGIGTPKCTPCCVRCALRKYKQP